MLERPLARDRGHHVLAHHDDGGRGPAVPNRFQLAAESKVGRRMSALLGKAVPQR
jgi:hypothetical protein